MSILLITGTTWTQEIVWQIIHNGKVDYRPLHVRMPWIDGMPYDTAENPYPVTSAGMMEKMFESFPTPRVFKTHLPYDLVPKAHGQAYKARYIYVIRNPKDAAVSLYEFMSSMPNPPKLNWNEFCELFFQGKGRYFISVCTEINYPVHSFSGVSQNRKRSERAQRARGSRGKEKRKKRYRHL